VNGDWGMTIKSWFNNVLLSVCYEINVSDNQTMILHQRVFKQDCVTDLEVAHHD